MHRTGTARFLNGPNTDNRELQIVAMTAQADSGSLASMHRTNEQNILGMQLFLPTFSIVAWVNSGVVWRALSAACALLTLTRQLAANQGLTHPISHDMSYLLV